MAPARAVFAFLLQTFVAAAMGAEVQDSWSPLLHWRATGNLESSGGVPAGWYVSPVHAAALPSGQLSLIARAREEETPVGRVPSLIASFRMDPGAVPDPDGNVWVDEDAVPVECGGALPARELAGMHGLGAVLGRSAGVAPDDPDSGPCGGDGMALTDHIGCSGHVQTADGRLFVAGGTRILIAVGSGERLGTYGVPNGFLFDPDGGWQRISQRMMGRGAGGRPLRWYPTATRLADARILVTAGFEQVRDAALVNRSVEIWDPDSEVEPWRLLSEHAESPAEIVNRDYPHVFVLPQELRRDERSFDIVMLGAAGTPVLLSTDPPVPAADRWWVSSHSRPRADGDPHPGWSASTILLPLRLARGAGGTSNGTLLTAGGYGDAERQIDRYDPVRDSWGASITMGVGRRDPSAVLLPDLTILVVAGVNADSGDGDGERRAEYLDPVSGTLERGSSAMGEARGYHSVALLLPDGRVLVGSGFPALGELEEQPTFGYLSPPLKEQPTFRYLSPPYMGEPRPRITVAPDAIRYAETFGITWAGDAAPKEANLLALGSMTHAVDMGQRAVQVAIVGVDPDAGTADLAAPADASWAPPGYYMLILLDGRRIPSEAHILHLGP